MRQNSESVYRMLLGDSFGMKARNTLLHKGVDADVRSTCLRSLGCEQASMRLREPRDGLFRAAWTASQLT